MVKKHFGNLKTFMSKCKRVWHSMTKPTREEFLSITKISAVGVLILGIIGFIISIVMNVFI